jgi:hypothetical protein
VSLVISYQRHLFFSVQRHVLPLFSCKINVPDYKYAVYYTTLARAVQMVMTF